MEENKFNTDANNESGNNPPPERPRSNRGLLYGILIVALAGTWAYLLWDKSKSAHENAQLQTQVVTIDSTKNAVEQQYNAALARLDELTSTNSRMDSLVKTKDKELTDLKARISSILNDRNATQAQLAEARRLIDQLNANVEGYKEDIERLQGEKIVLTNQRDSIKRNLDTAQVQNQELTQKVELGSVLHASNIQITPIHIRNNGKEVETSKAKRADMMRVSFDLDPNRVTASGEKTIYVSITAPDGTPLAVEALGSGRFTTEDGTEKLYTAQKTVNYTTGQKQTISINWKQNSDFKPGTYKVEIYDSGYLIGQGDVAMKKGGLF